MINDKIWRELIRCALPLLERANWFLKCSIEREHLALGHVRHQLVHEDQRGHGFHHRNSCRSHVKSKPRIAVAVAVAGKKLKRMVALAARSVIYTVPLPRGATHGSWRPLARSSTFWRSLDTVFCFTWKKWDGVAGKRLHTQMLHGNDATTTIWRRKQMLSQRLTPIDGVGLKATLKCTISPFDIPPCTLRKQTDSVFFREQCHSHNR